MSHPIGRRPLLAALPATSVLIGNAAQAEGDPLKMQKATFTTRNFKLASGTVMPEVTIAYETYAWLSLPDREPLARGPKEHEKTRDWSRAPPATTPSPRRR